MTPNVEPRRHSWPRKLRWASRGVASAIRAERNFQVHLAMAVTVVVAAALVRASLVEWCLLVLCTAVVLAAEMFNTALEHLARAITRDHSDEIKDALDTSGGAVLLAAIGAALVGIAVFGRSLGVLCEWWNG